MAGLTVYRVVAGAISWSAQLSDEDAGRLRDAGAQVTAEDDAPKKTGK